MLMNCDELILSINKRLQDSGIIDDVTDFLHEHPECFTKCSNSMDIISSCSISIAMCCSPDERQTAGVFVLADIGTTDATITYLSDHSRTTGTKIEISHNIKGVEANKYVCD